MSSKQEDENYWNRSDFKPFSFDEEELTSKNRLFGSSVSTSFITDIIFDDVSTVQKSNTLKRPLESLISKYSLNKIFEEQPFKPTSNLSEQEELRILRRQINNQWIPANVTKTIRLIITEQPYSLHLYRSLALKKDLLDEAIRSGDGNAILAIVLFLSKSLKKALFYQVLQTRPIAVAHYVQYLNIRMMASELIDLLEMLGQTREAAMKQFAFITQGIQNKETKLHKLNTCNYNHFNSSDAKDQQFIQDYIQFLQWFVSLSSTDNTAMGNSVLSSLSYTCKNHWNESKTNKNSPWYLTSLLNISERQLQWTILTSRSATQSWEDIETHFLIKGWISGKKFKSVIPIEKIIIELHRHGAPYYILTQYLEMISNLEKRLELAKQLPCHRAVIDVLVLLKDRQGLMEYKFNLKAQSEEYLHAENALRSQTKWKN